MIEFSYFNQILLNVFEDSYNFMIAFELFTSFDFNTFMIQC